MWRPRWCLSRLLDGWDLSAVYQCIDQRFDLVHEAILSRIGVSVEVLSMVMVVDG